MKPDSLELEDIRDASDALAGIAVRTPLLENRDVNDLLSGRLLIKAECMQRTGAFKFRGAYNCLRQLDRDERARGAITYSSGNHALGLALAAKQLGSTAMIVMPDDADPAKVEAVRALDAEIVFFNRDRENSDERVSQLAGETGRTIVPPSSDFRVVAGAGTVALEMLEQKSDPGTIDSVLVPCGGGGLSAAVARVMRALSPGTRVFAAEPELFDDMRRSLGAGERVRNPVGGRTICDAIMTPTPTALTFPINLDLLAGGLVSSPDEVCAAMRFAYDHFKLVVEPGAVVGLAAILSGKLAIRDQTVATIVTGGNIHPERYSELIAS